VILRREQGRIRWRRSGQGLEQVLQVGVAGPSRLPSPGREQVDRLVASDAEEPASERAACRVVAIAFDRPSDGAEDLLGKV
jgi:hypothetical protein